MTVKELIEKLKNADPETEVKLALKLHIRDCEVLAYNRIIEVDVGAMFTAIRNFENEEKYL
jgi:hypothetical protein